MNRSRRTRALAVALMAFGAVARSQFSPPDRQTAHSASGQFTVSFEPDRFPDYRRAETGTNADVIRLDAPFLAVSAERFKTALWRELGLAPDAPWSGKVFLALHSAQADDERVTVISQPFLNGWNYRVELPDQLARDRCARALTAVLLLEIANRSAGSERSAEIPAWLVDGLSRRVMDRENGAAILSGPERKTGGIAETRLEEKLRGVDPLASARRALRDSAALTFDRLSWPTGAQLDGADGGVYFASAQLFVHELLGLKNGAARLRALLAQLPARENWQTAFFAAFKNDFNCPLAVEKWWSLRTLNFAARDSGPQWTADVSRNKLDAILAVPVAVRYATNEMPVRAEISLQAAVRNFEPAQRTEILQNKLRDLQLVGFRLAPAFAALADGYRSALAEFLGVADKRASGRHLQSDAESLIRQLDKLDARRRGLAAPLDRNRIETIVRH